MPNLVLVGDDTNFNQFIDLSSLVPVVITLGQAGDAASAELQTTLKQLVLEYSGRFVLVTVDGVANPQLVQAFGAQGFPTTAAIMMGRPVPLFAGSHPVDQVRGVVEQVLELAAREGVTGVAVPQDGAAGAEAAPVEAPLPPLHAEAHDAIEKGDYVEAVALYEKAIKQDPRDTAAVAGLAQVKLLARLQGKTAAEIRTAAGDGPQDTEAQLAVADLDLSGGHIDDAFDRLLVLFPSRNADDKNLVRTRLLELFEVVGTDDPRVIAARARLTGLLY